MYPCRCLDWAKEQKHMIYHALGPNVKQKLWANDKTHMVGNAEKTWTGQAHSSFFDIPVDPQGGYPQGHPHGYRWRR